MDSPLPPDPAYLQQGPSVKRVILEVLRPPYPSDEIRKNLDAVFRELGFVPNTPEKISKHAAGGIRFNYQKFGGDSVEESEIHAKLQFFRALFGFTLSFS